MQIINISIVCIKDKKNNKQVTENLEAFVGQRAVLVFDKNNKADPRAVKAVLGRYVGFVRKADVHKGITAVPFRNHRS